MFKIHFLETVLSKGNTLFQVKNRPFHRDITPFTTCDETAHDTLTLNSRHFKLANYLSRVGNRVLLRAIFTRFKIILATLRVHFQTVIKKAVYNVYLSFVKFQRTQQKI